MRRLMPKEVAWELLQKLLYNRNCCLKKGGCNNKMTPSCTEDSDSLSGGVPTLRWTSPPRTWGRSWWPPGDRDAPEKVWKNADGKKWVWDVFGGFCWVLQRKLPFTTVIHQTLICSWVFHCNPLHPYTQSKLFCTSIPPQNRKHESGSPRHPLLRPPKLLARHFAGCEGWSA